MKCRIYIQLCAVILCVCIVKIVNSADLLSIFFSGWPFCWWVDSKIVLGEHTISRYPSGERCG